MRRQVTGESGVQVMKFLQANILLRLVELKDLK